MHYWRKDTFDALTAAADAAAEAWPQYSAFARLQAQGLRDQALAALRPFAADLAQQPFVARWRFAQWLFGVAMTPTAVADALAPYPLRREVLAPTLAEARAAAISPEAFWWSTRHLRPELAEAAPADEDPIARILRDGLAAFPDDKPLRIALAAHLMSEVEHSAHHLNESRYLGDAERDVRTLTEVRKLIGFVPMDAPIARDLERLDVLVRAWLQFEKTGRNDFPNWCRERGVEPPEPRTRVYYKK